MLSAVATPTGFVPDPVLPARDRLLDEAAMGGHLADRLTRPDGGPATLVRTKYRIGQSLRVVYRLAGGELVAGRMFGSAADAAAVYERGVPSAGAGITHDRELSTVWWTFPHDRRLRGLAAALQPRPRRLGLPDRRWVASELVEYAPERSATFRAVDIHRRPVGYLKAYAPGTADVDVLARRYADVADRLAARAASGPAAPVTPRPRSWSPEAGLLLLDVVPGVRWADLPAGELPAALHRLGAAIAVLHDIPIPPRLAPFGRLRSSRLRASAELIGQARPDVAAAVGDLLSRLAAGPVLAGPAVVLHGDCHPKNALVDADRTGLVDLDQAGVGAAAADLGSLLARLHQDELLGGPAAADLGAAVLAGYAEVRSAPGPAELRWHTGAAVLAEQAMRAVNRVRRPALAVLPALLAVATDVLDGRA